MSVPRDRVSGDGERVDRYTPRPPPLGSGDGGQRRGPRRAASEGGGIGPRLVSFALAAMGTSLGVRKTKRAWDIHRFPGTPLTDGGRRLALSLS